MGFHGKYDWFILLYVVARWEEGLVHSAEQQVSAYYVYRRELLRRVSPSYSFEVYLSFAKAT